MIKMFDSMDRRQYYNKPIKILFETGDIFFGGDIKSIPIGNRFKSFERSH